MIKENTLLLLLLITLFTKSVIGLSAHSITVKRTTTVVRRNCLLTFIAIKLYSIKSYINHKNLNTKKNHKMYLFLTTHPLCLNMNLEILVLMINFD